ncbi:hypothetical protein RMATCC62417_09291 [Rhizopus microsporus]|nr:hypothetical protein RMATCC62417_09291 [Rhizopus microsporus]
MSIKFPTCSYFGCDIVNVVNEKTRPKSFTFELTNVVKGLPYPDSTFDFVQIRYLVYALKEEEWPIAIKEALRATKIGGFLQLIEHDLKDHHGNNATHRFADSVHVVSNSRGQNARIGKELERMVGEVGGAEIVRSNASNVTCVKLLKSKRFAWSWHEVAKGMMPAIKSVLGLKDEQDEEKFLTDLWHSLRTNSYDYIVYAVLSRKV